MTTQGLVVLLLVGSSGIAWAMGYLQGRFHDE